MRWFLIFALASVFGFGSISCAENYNNFGSRLQTENFNSLYNQFQNFGSIQQPSGHWHYKDDDEDEADNFEEETTDEDDESDPDLAVDGNDPDLEDDEEQEVTNQDGLDEIQSDSRHKNDVLSPLPASKSQLKSPSSTLDKQSEGTKADPKIDSSVSESDSTFNDVTEENSSNSGVLGESFGNDISQFRSQTQSGDISNLFGGLLASGILSSSTSQNRGETKLNGDISNLIAGILGSSLPKSTLSNSLHKGVSKIGNIRNSVLDFRDRALDQRVGRFQRGELNQFDPRFQASLSNPNSRGSTGADQLTWNSLRDLVNNFRKNSPAVQQNNQGRIAVKNVILGSAKGALTANKGSGKSINNSGTKKDEDSNQSVKSGLLGLLAKAVSNKEEDNAKTNSNRGGRFRFLTDAKNFVVNPVDFVERKIRNKIKNEIKQSVNDITNRVDHFKSNMTSLASGLAESFKTKPSVKSSKNCLKILTGPQAHQLFLNGKRIPQARIFYIDKLHPLDFNSCPINHQDEVLKNCLLKGNVLVLSQPDKVKVEEEHGRQLEMIIAKDVVKDRLNGMVDTFFQNFGRQFLKGMHIFRGDNND